MFRRTLEKFIAPPCSVVHLEQVIVNVTDSKAGVLQRAVYAPIDLTSKEASDKMPHWSDYTLENLAAAGVPLSVLPTSNYLTPSLHSLKDAYGDDAAKLLVDFCKSLNTPTNE